MSEFYKISEVKWIPWEMGCCYDEKDNSKSFVANREDIFIIVSSDSEYNKLYNINKNYIIYRHKALFDYCFIKI